ncbi:MAG: M56 family metallopeptidase [Deltaproteobacteria bacterium]|nr:M56 family metallopeptidase [Deltaproteobacteria bacterium]
MILFIPIIVALAFAWLMYAFPQMLVFTATVAEWCQSLFLQCLEYLLIVKISFLWLGFGIVAAAFMYAFLKAAFMLIRTQRQIKNLPLADYGDIMIIRDDKLKTAFTHGFFNPKIYISRGLINSLDSSEFQAVYLHELHHKNRKDPLKLFILSILRDAFLYIPISRFFAEFMHSKAEAAADDAVVAKMKEPISLAGALLKIAGFNNEIRPAPAGSKQESQESEARSNVILQPASINGFGSTEARIKRLIQETEERVNLPAIKTSIVSILISGFLAMSLTMPLFISFPAIGQCDTSHCAVHMNKLGKDCQSHCETSQKHSH